MTQIVVLNPRTLDGEPHEVAEKASRSVERILEAAQEALEHLHWAARGAWMSAEEHRLGDMPDGAEFNDSAHGLIISEVHDTIAHAHKRIGTLTNAVAWNPRSHL